MNKYSYGSGSVAKLNTVEYKLRTVCRRALGYGIMDASVIQGVRSQEEQNRYFTTSE